MSDNFLRIIPVDVDCVPDAESVRLSTSLPESLLPKSDRIAFKKWTGVQFVDQGRLFERVSCPKCEGELDLDWWGDRMSSKWNENSKQFESLDVETPCCLFKTSLNDLKYDRPAAFARCPLEVTNPNRDLTDEESRRIEGTMGCPVRKILARY
jgi:hypothetical protein